MAFFVNMDSPGSDRYGLIPLMSNSSSPGENERDIPGPERECHDDTPRKAPGSSFRDLSIAELWDLLILFVLYFSQGLPIGLAGGTVPTLLKPHLAYVDVGLIGLAFYPYSAKLLWSPLIDSYWTKKLGRRKSWIVPIQLLSGLIMIVLGLQTPHIIQRIEQNDAQMLWIYVAAWFCLIFLFASQGCAVDGWAVTLLPHSKAHSTSAIHSFGMTMGVFTSYTFFLLLNSSGLTNLFRSAPKDDEIISLGDFTTLWGLFYLLSGVLIAIFKKEKASPPKLDKNVIKIYKDMLQIFRIGSVKTIVLVYLLAGLGFEVNDAATDLKLLDKGFGQMNIAVTTLVNLPFDLASSFLAGSLCVKYTPMVVWNWAFTSRMAAALLAQLTVALYPKNGMPLWYLLLVYFEHVLATVSATTMFVASLAFHLRIADPAAGGTYMTLLATYAFCSILIDLHSHLMQGTKPWDNDSTNHYLEAD